MVLGQSDNSEGSAVMDRDRRHRTVCLAVQVIAAMFLLAMLTMGCATSPHGHLDNLELDIGLG